MYCQCDDRDLRTAFSVEERGDAIFCAKCNREIDPDSLSTIDTAQCERDFWKAQYHDFVQAVWVLVECQGPYEYPAQVLRYLQQDIEGYKKEIAKLKARDDIPF